jgi:hypothetical protein
MNTKEKIEKEMVIPEYLDKNLLTYLAGNMPWDLLEKLEK